MRPVVVPAALALVGLGAAFVLFGTGTPRGTGRPRGTGTPRDPPVFATERARVRVVALTDALVQPWALAFLPDGDILITERGGRLRLMHHERLSSAEIGGLPPVDARQQDGLMDLALHPLFAQNRTIFAHEEELLASLHRRIRDVRQGPDGLLYVLTDAGALLRLEPAP